jgi:hypothetical protein
VANQFLNTNWISMNVLRLLVNSLTVAEYFNTSWDKDFKKEFAVGASVQVKFPQKFLIRDGLGYDAAAHQPHLHDSFSRPALRHRFPVGRLRRRSKGRALKEEITEQYLQPAAAQLAQEIDSRAAQFAYQNSSNVIGILGTDPAAITTYYSVRRRMMEKAAPKGKRAMIISTSMMATLGGLVTSIFQPPDEVSKMFKDGALGRLAGFDWYESNSLWSHTAGTWAGAVTTTGANQSGTSLLITATAGDTFLKGDKFSIASVNAVNPMTRRIAGPAQAQQFTVTQDLDCGRWWRRRVELPSRDLRTRLAVPERRCPSRRIGGFDPVARNRGPERQDRHRRPCSDSVGLRHGGCETVLAEGC